LFDLGLLKDPFLFREEKISKKNFLKRSLINLVRKKNPKLSYSQGVKMIKNGKIFIQSQPVFSPGIMVSKEIEKYIHLKKK